MRCGAVAGVACVVAAGPAVPSAAGAPGSADGWRPPVPGAVVRPYVEPAAAFAPGHRGVDFAALPGTPVRAAGRGEVVFAGAVAGALHVVVLHRGDVRTSYSFLAEVRVTAGATVEAGDVVGIAGGADPDHGHGVGLVHFGLRVGDRYVDPSVLFGPRDLRDLVRLVPLDAAPGLGSPWTAGGAGDEVAGLTPGLGPPPSWARDHGCGPDVPLLGAAVDAVCEGVEWAANRAHDALRAGLGILADASREGRALAARLGPELHRLLDQVARATEPTRRLLLDTPAGRVLADLVEIGTRILEWVQRECDTRAAPADGTGGSGRLVMAVGGLHSASRGRNRRSFGLDTDALGYARADVHWFSYAADGGAYTKADTEQGLRKSAKLLAAQLREVAAREPGREVDLIAHSQGGLVVEWFLRHLYDPTDPGFPRVRTAVTLATPHQGAPLATTVRTLRSDRLYRRGLDVLDDHLASVAPERAPAPSDAKSVRQLAEGSKFLRDLRAKPLPDGVELTTIGGTDDLVVPANRIRVPGTTEVVVDVAGANDHSALPRDPNALMAVRSALEGRPPPCTSALTGLRAAVEPVVLSRVERSLGEYAVAYRHFAGVRKIQRAREVLR